MKSGFLTVSPKKSLKRELIDDYDLRLKIINGGLAGKISHSFYE